MWQKINRASKKSTLLVILTFLATFNYHISAQEYIEQNQTESKIDYTISSGWWGQELVWGHFDALGLIEESPGNYSAPEGVSYPTAYAGGIFILDFMPKGDMNAEKLLERIEWVLDIRINNRPLNLSFTMNLWTRDSVIIQRMKDGEIPYYDERVASGEADSALFEIRQALSIISSLEDRDISIRFMQEHVSGIHSDVVKGGDSWRDAWERAESILDPDDQFVWIWHPNNISHSVRENYEPRDWDAFSSSTYQIAALNFLENSIEFADTVNKPFIHIECGFSGINDPGDLNENTDDYLIPLTDILQAGIDEGVVKGIAWQNRPEGWFSNADGTPWVDAVIHKYDEAFTVWESFLSENIVTNVESPNFPKHFELFQNYPNPFNPTTEIRFTIPSVNRNGNSTYSTKLVVYDILGREIKTLLNKNLSPGKYELEFDAGNLSGGIYFYKLLTGTFTETKKMILLK